MIQLVLGNRADTWVMASDPERLNSGAGVCVQVHSFENPCTDVTCIDEASANLPSLHESEVKLGVELIPVYRSHFNRSVLITLWRCLRGNFALANTR